MNRQWHPAGKFAAVVCGLACVLAVGCGESSKYAQVSGSVTLDGKPVENATVSFLPKGSGRPAGGNTDANGVFELTTDNPGDGALAGRYIVTVTAVDIVKSEKAKALEAEYGSVGDSVPGPPPNENWRVPRTYSELQTSGLEFVVKQGENNVANFDLKTRP